MFFIFDDNIPLHTLGEIKTNSERNKWWSKEYAALTKDQKAELRKKQQMLKNSKVLPEGPSKSKMIKSYLKDLKKTVNIFYYFHQLWLVLESNEKIIYHKPATNFYTYILISKI